MCFLVGMLLDVLRSPHDCSDRVRACSPWLLYGFSLLAVPIVIHLWQRKKVGGTVPFWDVCAF